MEPYAVIETGGKQYLVREGDLVQIERLETDIGQSLPITPVLAVSDGSSLTVGTPALEGASVGTEILDHPRGRKLVAFKKKRRKGYSRKIGHRQDLTLIKVNDINLGV